MPKPMIDDASQEVALTQHALATDNLPVFEGVKVVYLGTRQKRALSMKGRVNVETAHLPDGRTLVTKRPGRQNGRQFYDFTLRDQHGQLTPWLMPKDHPEHAARERPFAVVEHPDHLYEFARARAEFMLVGLPDVMRHVDEYIMARERARTGRRRDLSDITGSQEEVVTAH